MYHYQMCVATLVIFVGVQAMNIYLVITAVQRLLSLGQLWSYHFCWE